MVYLNGFDCRELPRISQWSPGPKRNTVGKNLEFLVQDCGLLNCMSGLQKVKLFKKYIKVAIS